MLDYLLWFEELTSTQDFLKERELPVGTVVVSNRQTKGRGRHGRFWHSQEGGLYFSFLLDTDYRDSMSLPLVLGYALSEYMRAQGLVSAIKWTNDVFVKGKKIAGILVERIKKGFVCGVGVNVNQEGFPPDVQAISMFMADGVKRDRVEVLLSLLQLFEDTLKTFRSEGFVAFRELIKSRLLFLDQEVIVYAEKPVVGVLKDLAQDGSLILLTAEGELRVFSGDLTLRGLGI